MIAPLPSNEGERLQALHHYNLPDTGPEQVFDDITLLASQICGTKISTISLIDQNRQWFKSKVGTTISENFARNRLLCAWDSATGGLGRGRCASRHSVRREPLRYWK
jgi:hypothetical protein